MKKNATVIVLFLLYFRLPCQVTQLKRDTLPVDSISLYPGVFSSSGDVSQSASDQQEISNLLQASPDVFSRSASFHFSSARYQLRGLHSKDHLVMINGVSVNDPSTGAANWSSWGGLTDVTSNVESRQGLVPGRYGFSGAGGYSNIDVTSSTFKRNTRVAYSAGNRNFHHRLVLTHSSGLTRTGWAFCFSASLRTGEEVQIPGTYLRGQSFFAGIDKRLSPRHTLGFSSFIAPLEQGRRSAATLETFSLARNNYYNNSWGYQDGKKRNANVSKTARPVFLLSHKYDNGDKGRLTTSFFVSTGKTKNSSLNWSDAPNPMPDYYRYLPGYYYLRHDSAIGDALTLAWADENNRQINWDRMIDVNRNNLYSDPHTLGQGVNTTETRARYIVEDQVENLRQGALNILFNRRIKNTFLSSGVLLSFFNERKYKEVKDLLGATFWLDVDQFAENLGVEESLMQNDIDQPNRKVRQGERFGYDYAFRVMKSEGWLQAEHSVGKIELYAGGLIRFSQISREGFTANGKFPNTSKGEGKKLNYVNGSVKAGGSYKVSGRNFITFNCVALTRAPDIDNIYVSPRVRNDIVNNSGNEALQSADLSWNLKYPGFRFRVTAYFARIQDQVWLKTFWHDVYNNNVNMIMTNVDEEHQGFELGIEKDIFKRHTLQFITGYGVFCYSGQPSLQAWQDNNAAPLFKDRTVYLNNYRLGESPQTIAALGYKYSGRKNWFINMNLNYAGGIYVEPNPDRRTEEAVSKYMAGEEFLVSPITAQEKLPGYYFVNAMGGKSFRIRKSYFMSANISLNNLLNNRNARVSGFEQMRWGAADISTFPAKYTYLNGFTVMFTISVNFK